MLGRRHLSSLTGICVIHRVPAANHVRRQIQCSPTFIRPASPTACLSSGRSVAAWSREQLLYKLPLVEGWWAGKMDSSVKRMEHGKKGKILVGDRSLRSAEEGLAVSDTDGDVRMRRRARRAPRRRKEKVHQSVDGSPSRMSELPFACTTPSASLICSSEADQQKKKKRKLGEGGRVASEYDLEKKKKKKEMQRPNYFVSLPITNKKISETVSQLQEAVLQNEPRLAKAMIPVASLHITLLVTHLANQEQVDLAAHALSQVSSSLVELLGGRDLVLPFAGIGQFKSEVAFVSLTPGEHNETLTRLAEVLRGQFEELGLSSGDRQGFKPHLTFMKLSKAPRLRSQGLRRLDPALWSDFSSRAFGQQTMDRLDLCSMMKKKLPNGYYHTDSTLGVGRRAEPDEEELLKVSRRLVDEAVTRALQQFKQETHHNGGGPTSTDPPSRPTGNKPATTINTQTTSPSSPLIVNAALETTESK